MAPDLISRIRTRLLLQEPFFGTLSMRLQMIADESIPTLRTNGEWLKYNPEFIAGLTDAEQLAVMAHEVSHCALLHVFRRGNRDNQKWNEACDYAVNQILIDSGMKLPKDCLMDAQYKGMSAEEIYSKRRAEGMQNQPEPQDDTPSAEDGDGDTEGTSGAGDEGGEQEGTSESQESGTGTGQSGNGQQSVMGDCPTGEFEDAPSGSEASTEGNTQEDWTIAAEQAARACTAAGHMPAGAHLAIQGTREPVVDWVTELREFMTHTVPAEYSWTTPNRRFVHMGVYLPGVTKQNTGELVVAVDTSGSTLSVLDVFSAEVGAIIRECRPERVVLIYCDSKVQGVEEFGADDFEVKLSLKGGGGTAFSPVFTKIEEMELTPDAMLYLTDLDSYDRPVEPGYPVLWIVPQHVRQQGPFGRTVRIEEVK